MQVLMEEIIFYANREIWIDTYIRKNHKQGKNGQMQAGQGWTDFAFQK
jgi:hypothetical protein